MSLIDRVLKNLEDRRERVLSGGINCIPSPFKQFRNIFPGIEQGKLYLISAGTKGGKSQLTNFLFVYTPLLYAYYHPEQIRLQIFYYPLEESVDKITLRFMSYLLYTLSDCTIRISPLDLQSVNANRVVDKRILDLLHSIEYQSILRFFEDHVHFMSSRNPTGYWKDLNTYAEEAGTIHRRKIAIENKETNVKQEKEVFDYYEPKDPDEYVISIWDHVGLTATETNPNSSDRSLKGAIDKIAEYSMIVRNKYNYIPVVVQQQNNESLSLEAFKANKIRPTFTGLADSKDVGKACSVMIGLTNPAAYEITPYCGYQIDKLKSFARFMEVVLNREGQSNELLALYFDGAVNYFAPLPSCDNLAALKKVYSLIENNSKSN